MCEETKKAVRLLLECANELSKRDDGTLERLKAKLNGYLIGHLGLDDDRNVEALVCSLSDSE